MHADYYSTMFSRDITNISSTGATASVFQRSCTGAVDIIISDLAVRLNLVDYAGIRIYGHHSRLDSQSTSAHSKRMQSKYVFCGATSKANLPWQRWDLSPPWNHHT